MIVDASRRLLICATTAVLGAGYVVVVVVVPMLGVLVDTSQTPGPSNLAWHPNQFSRVLQRLTQSAVQPHSHRSRVSSDRLQLSYFKLEARVTPTWHF
jgi:hypothetical protein